MAQALIARGRVWHKRIRPREHVFNHATYFLMLPMRSARQQALAVPRRKWGLITFADQDHGVGGPDALAWFDALMAQEGIADADGEVWLQTFPRVLGFAFKPVSFWYAHRQDGSLAAVVAEVNNTFGERHCYLLHGPHLTWGADLLADKVFHVSPFCSVDGHYSFRFMRAQREGAERLVARIDLYDAKGPLLQTSVSGHLEPFTAASAWRAFLGTPLMTLGVVARIHWHAMQLLLKRVPFFHKPAAPERFVTR